MPELPEIATIARQMDETLPGKEIALVEILQPKCLNMPPDDMQQALLSTKVGRTSYRGKWLFTQVAPERTLLINLGMGADLVYTADGAVPSKYQFRVGFSDGSGFTIRFWWFGYVHLMPTHNLSSHELTADLGPSALDEEVTGDAFAAMLRRGRGRVKPFLLDQTKMSGIGNAYIHDILHKSRVHPNRLIPSLSDDEVSRLYQSIREVLGKSLALGGAYYEKDFFGAQGGYTEEQWRVGYREGKPCPSCATTAIQKIKTGSTSTYICPTCQRI